MSKYHIPEAFIMGFIILSQTTNAKVKRIVVELNSADFGSNREMIAKSLSDELDIAEKDLKELIKSIFVVIKFLQNSDNSRAIPDLLVSIQDQVDEISDEDLKSLERNIGDITKITGPTIQRIKALNILTENEKNFLENKIITDIRIVFDEEIINNGVLKNAVILHTLKIQYSKADEKEEIFIALDRNDLDSLEETIKRAKEKEKSIREDKNLDSFIFLNLDKA